MLQDYFIMMATYGSQMSMTFGYGFFCIGSLRSEQDSRTRQKRVHLARNYGLRYPRLRNVTKDPRIPIGRLLRISKSVILSLSRLHTFALLDHQRSCQKRT